MAVLTPTIFEKLIQPGPRLPWLADWLLGEVWSQHNYQQMPPGQYLQSGEQSVNEVEEMLCAAAARVYDEVLLPMPDARHLRQYLTSGPPCAAVVFDGVSLREIPLLKRLAEQSGLRILEEGWSVAATPSETVDFIAARLGVGSIGPTQLPACAALRADGITCHYLGQVNERCSLDAAARAVLVWSSFPDYRYTERDAKFPELFENLHNMMMTAWQNSVQAVVQQCPGRRILVTSDHGYVYFGSGCSFGWDNATVAPLTGYFGGDRFARLAEKPNPPDHRGVHVLADRGVAMIRGRVQTHPRGETARKLYKHGGLSLMEMLVPWLVLEAAH
ncbi:MAG TPA: hypothetical protein PKK06_05340 [Phycisphaerae bacterium]|nr:hypothetical protein [Phycisphaerae bacterium]HNU44819.1 hypothetical protein [Phycisphaerae bacterium]